MFAKDQQRSVSMGISILTLFALLASVFYATPVSAEGDRPAITVERLKGNGVGIKIVFSENTSGDLRVFLNRKKMTCNLVAPDTLYCIEKLRPNATGFLTFYENEAVTFMTKVNGPAKLNEDPSPKPCIVQFGGFKLASLCLDPS